MKVTTIHSYCMCLTLAAPDVGQRLIEMLSTSALWQYIGDELASYRGIIFLGWQKTDEACSIRSELKLGVVEGDHSLHLSGVFWVYVCIAVSVGYIFIFIFI